MDVETKMVEGLFGREKPITRDEFVRTWVSHVEQAYAVAKTQEDADVVRFAVEKVALMAGRRWDALPSPSLWTCHKPHGCRRQVAPYAEADVEKRRCPHCGATGTLWV